MALKGQQKRDWTKQDYAKDPQKYRTRHSSWRKRNPEKVIAAAFRHNRTKATKYSLLKCLAKRRGFELTISKEEYIVLISKGKCSYCSGDLSPTGMGIDRIDSRKGYIQGNVAACCGPCNTKKGCMEMAGFIFQDYYFDKSMGGEA